MDSILIYRQKVPIITVVDGCCASAATFLSVVGSRRLITEHSYMLIHQLSQGLWGTFREFEDEMENLKSCMEKIKNIYRTYTKIPGKKLDEMLKHDLWFDAKTCLKYGLVDEIISVSKRK